MSIELRSLHYSAAGQRILQDVSLHVRDGDCYGFLGHNGAGKTTALRIALGLLRPRSGKVIVDGFDAARHPREARARTGGLIEVPGFHGELSGSRNLRLLARLRGLSPRESRLEVERVLEQVSLSHAANKKVRAYSQGMRQRLGVAQALLGSPSHVILDEPMNGLDPEGMDELRTTLNELVAQGSVTVLLSSHQLDELEGLCNRIGILRRGEMLLEERIETLRGLTAEGRHALTCRNVAAAREVAEELGVPILGEKEDQLVVSLGERAPETFLRSLVASDASVTSFRPEVERLESVYLRATRGELPELPRPAPEGDPAEPHPPRERKARGFPIARVLRYEAARSLVTARTIILLAVPAYIGMRPIFEERERIDAALGELTSGTLATVTQKTAYEVFGIGLAAGLPILAVVLVAWATQSIASEDASGTLRNLLLTPQRRLQIALGKLFSLFTLTFAGYAVLVAATLITAGELFVFEGVYDVLPNGETIPHIEEAFLQEQLERLLWRPVLPLLALAATGFLFSSLWRRPVGALAGGLGAYLLLIFGWAAAKRRLEIEAWLPTTYLPRGFPEQLVGADTSFLEYYKDVSEGANNAIDWYADTVVTAPLAWLLVCSAMAVLVFCRRAVR